MKTVLITGASGFLGSNLIASLLGKGFDVIAILGRPEDKANLLPSSERLKVYPCAEMLTTDFGHVDVLIHTAFSRGDNVLGLTSSIELTRRVIDMVNTHQFDSIVNISSQGIYQRLKPGEKVTEEGAIGPETSYGLAKWAVESMFKLGCKKPYTNIRMASLSANARFLDFFVDSVIAGREITITSPNQYASIMDVSDAVRGIISIVQSPLSEWEEVYNLGPGEQYSILEYARSANIVGESLGYLPTIIVVRDSGKEFAMCMDCTRIESRTGWHPMIHKEEMLLNLFRSKEK